VRSLVGTGGTVVLCALTVVAVLTGCSSSSSAAQSHATERARACVSFSAATTARDASARATMLQQAYAAAVASGDGALAGGMDPRALDRARATGRYDALVHATTERCKVEGWKTSNACTFGRTNCGRPESG
jgi:hypothetical protein